MTKLRIHAFLPVLVLAAVAVACTPTDAETATKVKANLTADTLVKAAPINVCVEKKVVTLTGEVDTQAIKEQAFAVAGKTDGVGEVVDQLVVKAQGFGPGHGREMIGGGMGSGERHAPSNDEKRQ